MIGVFWLAAIGLFLCGFWARGPVANCSHRLLLRMLRQTSQSYTEADREAQEANARAYRAEAEVRSLRKRLEDCLHRPTTSVN